MTTLGSDWLTVAEACAYLRVTRATLYRWARQGRLVLYKLGSRGTRIKRPDLDRLLSRMDDAATWTALSEDTFAHDWDNEKDAVYDRWRELYGVRQG
jgi:excisionase family DNA binding protein